MILTNEAAKTVCMMAALLAVGKQKARVVIVTDSPRAIGVDYIVGPGRLMELLSNYGVSSSLSMAAQEIRVKDSDSTIKFVSLRNDHDLNALQGMEPHLIALDERSLFTVRMQQVMRARDRTGFTLDDLKRLQTVVTSQVHH